MATKNIKGSSIRQGIINVEEIVPSFCWSEDPTSHYLLVDLPGFKREEVKLQIDTDGNILASGERQIIKENKIIRFKQTFKAPENSQIDQTTGKFEGEVLSVMMRKKIKAASDNMIRVEHPIYKDRRPERGGAAWSEGGDSATAMVMEMVKKNRGIVITAVLAFSLGVLISKTFLTDSNSSPPNE